MAIDLVDQDALTALQAENIRLIGLLESHGIPWRMEASGDDRQKLEAPIPKALNVTLANLVYFDKAQLPQPMPWSR